VKTEALAGSFTLENCLTKQKRPMDSDFRWPFFHPVATKTARIFSNFCGLMA
jgi:hypothetical protein